ncbi:MAG: DUF4124 domain-containing protein [Gammaproteobacteria bacterium]|nr:DUF4124 domain-containing protein [Gammaproteobacteria bacterium]
MRIALFLAGWLLSLAAQPQEIYRWVDKDGIVHYADQPGAPDAARVTLQGLSVYEGGALAEPETAEAASPAAVSPYRALRIVQPAAEEVFFDGAAGVTVVAELEGELQPEHGIRIFLDGQVVAESLSAPLGPLARGTHVLRATVEDANGHAVISSPLVPFHVRQTSLLNPQRQPSAAPAPAPAPAPQPTPPRTAPVTPRR